MAKGLGRGLDAFFSEDNEDTIGLASIFTQIKENKPNILVYIQNCSNKRFC